MSTNINRKMVKLTDQNNVTQHYLPLASFHYLNLFYSQKFQLDIEWNDRFHSYFHHTDNSV